MPFLSLSLSLGIHELNSSDSSDINTFGLLDASSSFKYYCSPAHHLFYWKLYLYFSKWGYRHLYVAKTNIL